MCSFCEALTDNTKQVNWSVRSTFADDNLSEYLNEDYEEDYSSKEWSEDFSVFRIFGYKHEGNTYVGLDYRQEMVNKYGEKIIVSPFSESIQFNFCPICGNKISGKIKKFDGYHNHIISIDEKE
ncbi:hypothetical protein [Metabacillus sp. Hm71]|uniref:hypothetical protein n=1 Tax=Metabacillus sp. Hm71 TaxID=3450743 RepID=UPI003F43B0BA